MTEDISVEAEPPVEKHDTWERLRELQDTLDEARIARPTRHGSEQMAVDDAAGDALPLLLAVVEAAAVYRDSQRGIHARPDLIRTGDLQRARDDLDSALAEIAPNTQSTLTTPPTTKTGISDAAK